MTEIQFKIAQIEAAFSKSKNLTTKLAKETGFTKDQLKHRRAKTNYKSILVKGRTDIHTSLQTQTTADPQQRKEEAGGYSHLKGE